jgi:hypothetical protein
MDPYDSTSAESDMNTPRRHGRLPACDAPITKGYFWDAGNVDGIECQIHRTGWIASSVGLVEPS